MNCFQFSGKPALGACAVLFAGALMFWTAAQAQNQQGAPPAPVSQGRYIQQMPPAKPFPLTLTISEGTTASYRVREQFVGINFPSDAVGTSTSVTGMIAFNKDGSINSNSSKLSFDLRTLTSDQPRRDTFISRTTLKTDQYPMAVFVPKAITGMPKPLFGNFGLELTGDMSIAGTTAPVSWQGIATVDTNTGLISGRAMTSFPFAKFGLTIPKVGSILSVSDKVDLEVAFHFKIG